MRGRGSNRIRAAGLWALVLAAPAVISLQGCTDLDETPLSAITPENFFRNELEVIGGLASVYAGMRGTIGAYWNVSQVSSDEHIVPTRGSDWWDNGRWLELHRQVWAANSPSGLDDLNGTWNALFTGVARANVVLGALQNVTVADQAIVEAEVRALRAFYYFLLMDMFGGVPIVTDTEIAARPRDTRRAVFDFIDSELTAARQALPETWPANMHGRFTKGAVDAIQASMYLNAGVFTRDDGISPNSYNSCMDVQVGGQNACQAAVAAADRVINSPHYRLNTDWRANFAPDNHLSPENILVVKHTNVDGLGFVLFHQALHYHQWPAPSPWNGFATLAETYYAFDTAQIVTVQSPIGPVNLLESNDQRHEIFLAGRQSNVITGELVNDRPGNPLFFTPHIRDATAATEGEGVRIMKFIPDPNHFGPNNANDYPIFRVAEMHLIKAEALNELGQTADAVSEINTIRARVFDPPRPLTGAFTQESFRAAVLRERLFELTAEGKRRQDLIRHGQYLRPWEHKEQREAHRVLMPIPQIQLSANPELAQNPGY
jgi:starch-binding outer membrane protein, SusD/RagB family